MRIMRVNDTRSRICPSIRSLVNNMDTRSPQNFKNISIQEKPIESPTFPHMMTLHPFSIIVYIRINITTKQNKILNLLKNKSKVS